MSARPLAPSLVRHAPRVVLALFATATLALAGCVSPEAAENVADDSAGPVVTPIETPLFEAPILIDELRAGGEPVIAIAPSGTIFVSSHPGWTHYHPSSEPGHPGIELVAPANAQSYLWRSTDGGKTWLHVGIGGTEYGPRSTGFGVSDPEFTVMEDGTICYTDLEGLAMSSVSCSTDDGITWVGNPIASQRPNDRQWLASYKNELYFTANFFTDHGLLASTDRGLTWERRGDTQCSGDIVANPRTGTIYAGCGDGISVSYDGGNSFEAREIGVQHTRAMTEPAIDAGDNVWNAYATRDQVSLHAIGTPDDGLNWSYEIDLTPYFREFAASRGNGSEAENGTYVWPWISAGSEGRFAVSWIGAFESGDSNEMDVDWFIFTAYVINATSATPQVAVVQVTPEPIHHGPICQGGTGCQISSMQGEDGGDRRLGDFFETTIDKDGFLHLVYSNTFAKPADVISHVGYARQIGGVPLLLPGDAMPTQG